ncbi:MAG: hypothetical protein HY917_01260 [Candidatus Diapherotrites archaeon]|nr:hypothetical protein [Candidatus Diapherotrites archaeon]
MERARRRGGLFDSIQVERCDRPWLVTGSPLRVSSFIPFNELTDGSRVLFLGGHGPEISDFRNLCSKKGVSCEIHQSSLTDRFKTEGTVFHEGVSTLNLQEHMRERKLKSDCVISQNSFYPGFGFSDALAQLYAVLAPKGKAILFYSPIGTFEGHFGGKEAERAAWSSFFSISHHVLSDDSHVLVLSKKFPASGKRRSS